MKYLLFLLSCAISALVFSCGKDDGSKSEHNNQSLLSGTWNYTSAYRSTTTFNADGTVNYVNGSNYTQLNTALNHITFSEDGTAYSYQQGWGPGVSGALFQDTIHYEVKDKYILFFYPAGNNRYFGGYAYSAYQDTLFIKFLSADSLSFTRTYHYKHIAAPTELKQSEDQLIKQ